MSCKQIARGVLDTAFLHLYMTEAGGHNGTGQWQVTFARVCDGRFRSNLETRWAVRNGMPLVHYFFTFRRLSLTTSILTSSKPLKVFTNRTSAMIV